MKKRALFCSLSLSLALFVPPAAAQGGGAKPSTTEADALTDKARQLYEEGLKALSASRWAEAHASFLAAWRIKPHYQIASNLGMAELRLGKHRDAAEHLTWYLREAPETKVQERQRAEALLKEALAKVASIKVSVAPEGAEVSVDGAPAGVAPIELPVFVDPGEHTFAARMDGYETGKRTIAAAAGGSDVVEMKLERPVVAPPTGAATVVAPPPPRSPVEPVEPAPAAGPDMRVVIVGGAAAGATLIAGVVFTVVANGKAGDAEDAAATLAQSGTTCPREGAAADCLTVQDALAAQDTFSNLAFWSFVGAGVFAVGTMAYALVTPPPSWMGVRIAPVVGERGGGVAVSGSF